MLQNPICLNLNHHRLTLSKSHNSETLLCTLNKKNSFLTFFIPGVNNFYIYGLNNYAYHIEVNYV